MRHCAVNVQDSHLFLVCILTIVLLLVINFRKSLEMFVGKIN